jgi:hypothetical protein
MGIDIELEEYVNENTKKYGIGELNEISSLTIQEQLIRIEGFLQKICIKQEELNEEIKVNSKLSISSVSLGANVPRSQINLNTYTLKLYIENRVQEIKKADILNIDLTKRLKSEKKELTTYINGLRQQVVDTFELNSYIGKLEAENKRLIQQIEYRQEDIQKLELENNKLLKVLNEKDKDKIVPLGLSIK